MEPESGLILKNISSLANLNSRTKLEHMFKFLNIRLLGKGTQEKLYFKNIVSSKPTFLAN